MDLALEARVATVFGAARGIGAAIAGAFLAEGAYVAAIDRDPGVIHMQAVDDRSRSRSLGLVADVTDHAAVGRAMASVLERFGRCDHVVFAVGVGSSKFGFPFWNLEPADWEPVLRVNLVGAVNVAHAVAPTLVKAKGGTMLFISSIAGQIGSQTDPPYSAAKAGLINFAQCAAKDFAPYGVRVNTICPGMVKTPLNRSVWEAWHRREPESSRLSYEEWTAEKIKKLVPLNRWQEPEDIAAMAVFLASKQGQNITGQTINVDGGFVMHW
jgi:NAD(P)-dependent dehydrogenase (short-subunit alcohol dehydrogenase family)